MKFKADNLKVSGPNISDGATSVTFKTGEYESDKIAQIYKMAQKDAVYQVEVSILNVNEKSSKNPSEEVSEERSEVLDTIHEHFRDIATPNDLDPARVKKIYKDENDIDSLGNLSTSVLKTVEEDLQGYVDDTLDNAFSNLESNQ